MQKKKRQRNSAKKKAERRKIRFALVGLGHISQVAVLPAFRHARRDVELTALVSGDEKKLRTFSRRYHVPAAYSYDEYEACLESGRIDAVYIALPNRLHADYAVRALERGIHVLCEKPLALTEADCRRMIAASKKSGAKLMTAYRLHFDQANLKAIRLARRRLGKLRLFHSTFSYQIRDPENIRLQEEDGGGPLWDIGVYCINAARYFFQEEPIEVMAMSATPRDPRFREVPEGLAVSMKFSQERIANFVVSFGAGDSAAYDVLGEKGRLHLEAAYEYALPRKMTLTVGEKSQVFRFAKSDQFAPELIHFAECIRRGRDPEPSGVEGLADVRIILAIEESVRRGRAVTLGKAPRAIATKKRPRLSQWIQRPPVRKPETVAVRSPSG